MLLLAIDPAAERSVSNTGWALGRYSEVEPFKLLDSGVIEGGFTGFTESSLVLGNGALPNGGRTVFIRDPDVVVCEHYVVYNSNGDPTPMLIEGVIRYLRPDTILQPSSILGKKGLVPDSLLKAYGVYRTAGHHKDELSAIKHALYYVLSNRHKPTLNYVRTLTY